MQVLIMRHGDAVPDAASDALRARGVEESSQMAFWLHDQGVAITRVLVSPYVRAQQTPPCVVSFPCLMKKIACQR